MLEKPTVSVGHDALGTSNGPTLFGILTIPLCGFSLIGTILSTCSNNVAANHLDMINLGVVILVLAWVRGTETINIGMSQLICLQNKGAKFQQTDPSCCVPDIWVKT